MDADKKTRLARIHKLPDSLANQIAAGEVVERPASVVKELLENSFDAGATSIQVDVQKGGTQQIRVTDDGCGIHPDDIQLALERHATSKLHERSDLQRIHSLGFRGEALPSIASVSQFKLISRSSDSDQGSSIVIDALSNKAELAPAAHSVGTTIEVNNLFHVTPARRKFLSSERTEFLHILEMCRRMALANADVSLRLKHNDKQVLYCPLAHSDPAARVVSIMGSSFGEKALFMDYSDKNMRLWGWAGLSDLARNQSDRQYFYLNGRVIRDKRVNHAIRLAYESLIPPGRYPAYVLYLEMDVAAVDVNVHPTKYEVRFRHARDVHDFIYASLFSGLTQESDLIVGEAMQNSQEQSYVPALHKNTRGIAEASREYSSLVSARKTGDMLSEIPKLGYPLAQLRGHFILTELEEGFGLIDIKAARKYIAKIRLQDIDGVTERPLLVPVNLSFSEEQVALVQGAAELLQQYGLVLEAASPTSIMVKSIPLVLQEADIQSLITDVLYNLDKNQPDNLPGILCEHANDIESEKLEMSEVFSLLRTLEDISVDILSEKVPEVWKRLTLQDFAGLLNNHG